MNRNTTLQKEEYFMSVIDNWEQWKDFLGERLEQAEGEGSL